MFCFVYSGFKQAEAVSKEVKILSAVKHKYIVEFLHVEESHNTLLLFLEYMEGVSSALLICPQCYGYRSSLMN